MILGYYPPPCLQGTQGVFNSMPNSASLLRRRGSKILFFRGKHPPRQIHRKLCFSICFEHFSGLPFSSQRDSKGFPNGAPNCLKVRLAKIGNKFRPRNRACKKKVPRHSKKHAKWIPKCSPKLKQT